MGVGAGIDPADPRSRSAYHHGNLRQALIDEAKTVLDTEGLDAISLRGLARRLDVSHAAPSHHFADRNALLGELAADEFAVVATRLEAALGAGADWSEAGMVLVDLAIEAPDRYRLLFCSGIIGRSTPDGRLRDEAFRAFRALFTAVGCEKASRAEDAPFTSDGMFGCLEAPQLRAWSIVHGAICLYIDADWGRDEASFRELAQSMLTDPTPSDTR